MGTEGGRDSEESESPSERERERERGSRFHMSQGLIHSSDKQEAFLKQGDQPNYDDDDDFDSEGEEEMEETAKKSLIVSICTLMLSIPALIGA